MLCIPEVTLVCVETREHKLASMAVAECMKEVEFGDVLILTDKPSEFGEWTWGRRGLSPQFHRVPDWPDKLGWSRAWWFEVPPLLRTRQTLNIQWDSWIWDSSMWADAFLEYDYIGAPWWYKDGKNVGNGGFSLVSTRLKRYIADRRLEFPCDTHVDDDLLCRKYRPVLEDAGFRWAPERVAHQFAFECNRPSDTSRHFGFHAMFNWPVVLPHDKVLERVSLAVASPYIRESYMMRAFCQQHPEIIKELRDKTLAAEGESECLQSAPS